MLSLTSLVSVCAAVPMSEFVKMTDLGRDVTTLAYSNGCSDLLADLGNGQKRVWHDSDGSFFNCYIYSKYGLCTGYSDYGPWPQNNPMTARQACCNCGGGVILTSSPQVVSNAPQVVTSAPHVVSSVPYAVSSAPQVVSSAPHVVSSVPYAVSSAPHVVSSVPYAVSSAPQVVSSAPHVLSSVPYAVSSAPQVVSSAPQVVSSAPHVLSSVPYAVSSAPQVVSSAPQVVSSAPQVVSSAPQVVSSAPQVVSSAPQVVSSAPQVVSSAPHVASSAPQAVATDAPGQYAACTTNSDCSAYPDKSICTVHGCQECNYSAYDDVPCLQKGMKCGGTAGDPILYRCCVTSRFGMCM